MTIKQLQEFCVGAMKKRPELKTEIENYFYLALDEIEDGGSEEHECELAVSDINELLNN